MTVRPWKTCKLRPGSPLSFNGKVRVTLTHVEQVRLGDMTEADCRADGFDSCRAFHAAFRAHYPASSRDSLVWLLRFDPPAKDSDQSARASATSVGGPA